MHTEPNHRDAESTRALSVSINIDVLLASLGVVEGSPASTGINGKTTLSIKELQVLMGHQDPHWYAKDGEDMPSAAFFEAIQCDE